MAHLTEELMQLYVTDGEMGTLTPPFEVSQFLHRVCDGFSFIGNSGPYALSKKLSTLKQSLTKVDNIWLCLESQRFRNSKTYADRCVFN